MTIGERLNRLRKEQGLSYEALAAEIEVPIRLVLRWELDITVPDAEDQEKICAYFDVSKEALLNNEIVENNERCISKNYKWYLFALLLGVVLIIAVGSLLNVIGTLALILMIIATLNVIYLIVQLLRKEF